jgi:hypothetical protein
VVGEASQMESAVAKQKKAHYFAIKIFSNDEKDFKSYRIIYSPAGKRFLIRFRTFGLSPFFILRRYTSASFPKKKPQKSHPPFYLSPEPALWRETSQ